MRTVAAALLLATACLAQDPLGKALSALRAAPREKRAEAVAAVLALEPRTGDVLERLRKGVAVETVEPGWHLLYVRAEDGKKRPYQLYVPKDLDEPVPLLVHMHGGVNRPDFSRKLGEVGYGGMLWPKVADEHKFVVAFPEARSDCMWWSDAGVAHVRAVIRDAKRFAPIDDDAIVGTGFSDGGSGCFYLAMAAPDPFAAFLPMNGHPAVAARASDTQIYLHNLKATPLFVAMTSDDQLYPAASILPHLRPALALGARMHFVNYPTGGHQPVYFREQVQAFVRFIKDTPRDPAPMDLEWRCGDARSGRLRWLEVLEIGAVEGDAEELPDINIMSEPSGVRLGVQLDRNYAEAVRVQRVVKGSPAAAMGVAAGDILLRLDDADTPNMQSLRVALSAKTYGDRVRVTVLRGDKELEFEGRFPEFRAEPYYRRTSPTARIAISVQEQEIHVTSRNVRRFRLHLAPVLFGDGPITIRVNGRDAPAKIVTVATESLLQAYARDADAGSLFSREAVVDFGKGVK